MSKKKIIFDFFHSNRYFYFLLLLVVFSFFGTFFLENVPLAPFLDACIFVLFFASILTIYQLTKVFAKHKVIERAKKDTKLMDFRDFVEPNSTEESLIDLARQLRKEQIQEMNLAFRERQQMIDYYGMWSHQIKVPLAVIDLMVQTKELDLDVLKDELIYINQYIELIMQYVRMNNTETDYVFAPVELNKMVKASIKKYARFFIKKDLTIELEESEASVVTDEKWLQFVFEQILFNAIKYTKTGGVKICMSEQSLSVTDTGIGILAEDLPRIFDPGFTGLNGRLDKKASGLGLFMSKEILTKLGHEIKITSQIGVGTTVVIYFNSNH
ncbi:hypothetical protein SAMN02745116_00047 [Pilibacter termitis]|uniref:histidine kinase n=1 Tax=Pilibacter termitis TaxID=263852 RepID=A0A1T4K2B7_9ENTE|nr:sensor histidine kinase [Pilibacter termitis]SJZ36610.1 hypothetical protein SAMN02745116_00047 [Pilibacter termitis]